MERLPSRLPGKSRFELSRLEQHTWDCTSAWSDACSPADLLSDGGGGGGFFLVCKDLGRMFCLAVHSLPAQFFFFLNGD